MAFLLYFQCISFSNKTKVFTSHVKMLYYTYDTKILKPYLFLLKNYTQRLVIIHRDSIRSMNLRKTSQKRIRSVKGPRICRRREIGSSERVNRKEAAASYRIKTGSLSLGRKSFPQLKPHYISSVSFSRP